MSILTTLLIALVLTLVLELLFALVWGVRRDGLTLVVLMNIMTNPAANLLHHIAVCLLGWPTAWVVLVLELSVVVVEGFCCKGVIRRPWLFALLINVWSYSMGVLIQFLF